MMKGTLVIGVVGGRGSVLGEMNVSMNRYLYRLLNLDCTAKKWFYVLFFLELSDSM